MSKIAVSGSAGFIGGYLVQELLTRGHEVVGIDNFSKYGPVARSYDDHPAYRLVEGDCCDVDLMTDLIADYNKQRIASMHVLAGVEGVVQELTLQPGQSLTVAVNLVGTHHFYCSIHAHFDPATGQIAANPTADHPDEPMEGVVTVSAVTS